MFNWLKNILGLGEPSGVRARNAKGHFVKDDPNTPNFNEAYVDGRKPKRKPRKPAAKKAPAKKRGRPKGSKNKK
tara:strand:- start:489 stop:710 length:222 start_codon:yes stop_codon:yes gene_type:complete